MNENDIKNAADQAGKALGDASAQSNAYVQAKGPGVVDFIKRYWWVGAAVIGALFLASFWR